MATQIKSDDLKALYEQSTTQFRFFLTWRELLIAGYFATFSALCVSFGWSLRHIPRYACAIPFLGAALSIVFYLLDRRNRTLYTIASKASLEIEKKIGNLKFGYFAAYHAEERKSIWKIRHEYVLLALYCGGGALMLVAAVLSLFVRLALPLE